MANLTAKEVEKLKRPGLHPVGRRLYLRITPTGSRAWIFRYTWRGKRRNMGIGPARIVSLAAARDRAREVDEQLHKGIDPMAAAQAARVEAAAATNFRQAAELYIAEISSGWRSAVHARQWPSTLERFVYPSIGATPVAQITTTEIVDLLRPIWRKRPETARRVRGRIEAVLDWATAHGLRTEGASNPARWKGHLDKLLPKQGARTHHAALPAAEVPMLIAELHANPSISALALEFCILTATRTNETLGARFSEIDVEHRLWTVPAARTKAARALRVPLSARTWAIVGARRAIARGDGLLWPLPQTAMLQLLRGLRPGYTVHGFRSSFRDWVAECTSHSGEVAELALGHVVADATEASYRRGDQLEKRRALMRDWERFCLSGKPSD